MSTRAQLQALITVIGTGQPNTALEVRNILNALADSVHLTGDIKEIDCDNAYLTANFDGTGLGTNERLGWAICNGNNGTLDRNGLVGIAYGVDYPTLGAMGGSTDAVVVAHAHDIIVGGTESQSGYVGVGGTSEPATLSTVSEGVVGTDKNMQPYIVSLFIQKI